MVKISTYILSGSWNTMEHDGSKVVCISDNITPTLTELNKIKKNKAAQYANINNANVEEGERYYELTNDDGDYAKFYITEHSIELSDETVQNVNNCYKFVAKTP